MRHAVEIEMIGILGLKSQSGAQAIADVVSIVAHHKFKIAVDR
jgi:hypothetical protein